MASLTLYQEESRTVRRDFQTKTYTRAGVAGAWTNTTVISATVMIIAADSEDDQTGALKTAGIISPTLCSFTTDDIIGENDLYIGCTLEFMDGLCAGEKLYISDWVSGTGTIVVDIRENPLPGTPAIGDKFKIKGYPILPQCDLATHTDGTLDEYIMYFQLNPTNGATATPGQRVLILRPTWSSADSNTDTVEDHYTFEVKANTG